MVADECKPPSHKHDVTEEHVYALMKTRSETETEMASIFRSFLHENSIRIIFFFNSKFNCKF